MTKTYGWIPEWPKGTDCKSAANCFGGSNPPPSSENVIDFIIGHIFLYLSFNRYLQSILIERLEFIFFLLA